MDSAKVQQSIRHSLNPPKRSQPRKVSRAIQQDSIGSFISFAPQREEGGVRGALKTQFQEADIRKRIIVVRLAFHKTQFAIERPRGNHA